MGEKHHINILDDVESVIEVEPVYITPRILYVTADMIDSLSLFSFVDKKLPMHLIYNLDYNFEMEEPRTDVEHYPFDDEHRAPCAFEELDKLCASADAFLRMDPANCVVFYGSSEQKCSLFIAAYLMYSGASFSAFEAITTFHTARLKSQGAETLQTPPSYARYLLYYEKAIYSSTVQMHAYRIDYIRMVTVPNFLASLTESGCYPHIYIDALEPLEDRTYEMRTLFSSLPPGVEPENASFVPSCEPEILFPVSDEDPDGSEDEMVIQAEGDIRVQLYSGTELMAQFWFNTAFVERNYLVFGKEVLDYASSDDSHTLFSPDFKLEVFLHRDSTVPGHSKYEQAEILDAETVIQKRMEELQRRREAGLPDDHAEEEEGEEGSEGGSLGGRRDSSAFHGPGEHYAELERDDEIRRQMAEVQQRKMNKSLTPFQ